MLVNNAGVFSPKPFLEGEEAAKEAFFAAGYGTAEYLEVVVGVTVKTLSTYVNHAAATPLDPAFQATKWAA